jgi:hypothetical protein
MNRLSWKLIAVASLAISGFWTATSEAEWPRIRVYNSYSLPSAPVYRPVFQATPVILPAAPAPGYVVPNYGTPVAPNISVPGQGTSYYAPQPYAQPGYSQPGYAQPGYVQPGYAGAPSYQQNYAPAPTTSYYAPQQPAFQPYQRPLPTQQYAQPMQAPGGFYQPNRPATFYSPTPGYHYPQPVFGAY